MEAGVPQGSVLGSVLWNISFDGVLEVANDDNNCSILCYADDTLIVTTGNDLTCTRIRACVMAQKVISWISRLGLSVATDKTDAILFYGKGTENQPSHIVIKNVCIDFAASIKYLGVYIDIKWTFSDHFSYIVNKASRVIRALNRLMPNLRGPDENRRTLFANVILSVLHYGAPVWGDKLLSSQRQTALNSLMRSVAQRVISSYRTVSGNAVFLLARIPTLRFLAPMRKRTFEQFKRLKEDGEYTREARNAIKEAQHLNMCELWRGHLEKPNTPGEYTKMAIVPRLEKWLERKHGSMSFHLSQIMTGHGCFAKYLHRIGKRADTSCDFCGKHDDAMHTLKECPAWDLQRISLRRKLGLQRDFIALGDIVDTVATSWDHWMAFSAFTEEIMREKEDEKRRRERARSTSPFIGDDDTG
ncbi:reverse transcriptase [Lasius niger]|uniref:Reverse transcriptase n=1 Tax=Lasius niger TaxID=67767 RepID=A0A0J7KP92_LASNI|nr:reverse transcriptase [Lasius niger]